MQKKVCGVGKGDEICINCHHFIWMVGVGQGIRCSVHRNENNFPLLIESGRFGYCESFDRKPNSYITVDLLNGYKK